MPEQRSLIRFFQSPQVAFLFISKGSIQLDFLWQNFFQGADKKRPYAIYIHAPPGFTFNSTTTYAQVFYDKQIPNSVLVQWGEASMIEAERRLLAAALKDPRNERFILLSDSCLFLHGYNYVYDYVTMSRRSFVDSFKDSESNTVHRYNPKMAPAVLKHHWRKGSQWFTLIRRHAEAVVRDQAIFSSFSQHCKRIDVPDSEWGNPAPGTNTTDSLPPECIPDEHYIQVLLATQGMEAEVERRTLTYSHWRPFNPRKDKKGWHPTTYDLAQTTPHLLKTIQGISRIEYKTEWRTEWCSSDGQPRPCYLFARKFTRAAGVRVARRMTGLLGLTNVAPIAGII